MTKKVLQVSARVFGRLEFVNVIAENNQKAAFEAALFLQRKYPDKPLEAELISVTYYSDLGKTKVE